MKKIHYAWLVCAGCALLYFCTSGLGVNAFAIYQPFFISINGFTNAQSSTIITFRSMFSLLAMLLSRAYYKRLSYRNGMTFAGLLLVSAFCGFGLSKSYAAYCASAAVMGLAYGFGTMIPISMIVGKWFAEKRNTALGICSAITGLSTLGIPSVIDRSIRARGLGRTFFIEAGCMAALVFLSFLVVRDDPKEKGLRAFGLKEGGPRETSAEEDCPGKPPAEEGGPRETSAGEGCLRETSAEEGGRHTEAIATASGNSAGLVKRDWFLIAPVLLLVGAVTNVSYSHLTVLITGDGFPSSTAAIAMSVSGLTLTIGKLCYGRLGDILGNYRSNFIFAGIFLSGLVLCCLMKGNTFILFAAMIIYSFGIASMAVGLAAWAGDLSSEKDYARTVQFFQTGYSAGALVFSSVPGILADRAGGSYVPAFVMFTILAAAVYAVVQLMYVRVAGRRSDQR